MPVPAFRAQVSGLRSQVPGPESRGSLRLRATPPCGNITPAFGSDWDDPMNRTRTWIPYLWAFPLCASAWYLGCAVMDQTTRFAEYSERVVLLVNFTGYSITLVACSRRSFSLHQLGHLGVFVAAVVLGALLSNPERDLGMVYFSASLGSWVFAIVGVAACLLAIIRSIVPPRPPSQQSGSDLTSNLPAGRQVSDDE